jgi:hypothetical protein
MEFLVFLVIVSLFFFVSKIAKEVKGVAKGQRKLKGLEQEMEKTKWEIDKWGHDFLVNKSLGDYRSNNPRSFDKNGKFVSCGACGGSQIWVKRLGSTRHGIHNSHICKQCGTELWRSNLT